MNKVILIGRLTVDPVTRTNSNGKTVCNFSIAVDRRGEKDKADFFQINAWGALGENCAKFLAKGKKVSVIGSVSQNVFTNRSGETKASMNVFAEEVEFLSPKGNAKQPEAKVPEGYVQVDEENQLPF